MIAHVDLCYAHLELGRLRDAERHGRLGLALAEASGERDWVKNALYLLGEVAVLGGAAARDVPAPGAAAALLPRPALPLGLPRQRRRPSTGEPAGMTWMIRRLVLVASLLALCAPVAGHAAAAAGSAIGASGELYSLHSGTYRSLFADAPAGDAGDNAVLALDVVRDGVSQRLLVPGTDGPENERWPALTVDRATNRVFLVWEAQRPNFPLSVLNLIAFSDAAWGSVFQFAADPFSYKSNPQLATTLDRYQMFGAEGEVVSATRTILHLAWYDDDGGRQRVLYSPLVVEGGEVLQSNRVSTCPKPPPPRVRLPAARPSQPTCGGSRGYAAAATARAW